MALSGASPAPLKLDKPSVFQKPDGREVGIFRGLNSAAGYSGCSMLCVCPYIVNGSVEFSDGSDDTEVHSSRIERVIGKFESGGSTDDRAANMFEE